MIFANNINEYISNYNKLYTLICNVSIDKYPIENPQDIHLVYKSNNCILRYITNLNINQLITGVPEDIVFNTITNGYKLFKKLYETNRTINGNL